jgi:NADH-quinone oxidoreductase subunit N
MTVLAQLTPPPPELLTPRVEFLGVAPDVVLAGTALLVIALLSVAHRWPGVRRLTMPLSVVGLGVAGGFLTKAWSDVTDVGPYQTLGGMVAVDGFSVFVKTVVLAATFLALLVAHGYLRREGLDEGPYHALVLLSASGMLMMASANDLIVVFLAIEVLSIALYVLAAYHREQAASQEAGLKYFVLGAFSSAIFLYGVAFVYGATGTTSLPGIASFLARTTLVDNVGLLVGIVLLLVGFGFKIAAVPFHMWTPDVYQGAPTPVTAFMASGTKAAAFAGLLRVLFEAFGTYRLDWQPLVWGLAAVTMVVGSLVAIVQTDVKRMLAYSSISHAGFILIGVQTATGDGASAALTYLFAYAFIVVGSFAVVTVVSARGEVGSDLASYRGLSVASPWVAAAFALLLFAQAGMPLTSGFVAKLAVFRAAVDQEQYALAILGVLVAVVAAFVYLRIVVATYLTGDTGDTGDAGDPGSGTGTADVTRLAIDWPSGLALALAAGITLAMGVAPNVILKFAERATLLF